MGGGGGGRRTELTMAVSGRIFPAWMKRRRLRAALAVGVSSWLSLLDELLEEDRARRRSRMRCLRATMVVRLGEGMSS